MAWLICNTHSYKKIFVINSSLIMLDEARSPWSKFFLPRSNLIGSAPKHLTSHFVLTKKNTMSRHLCRSLSPDHKTTTYQILGRRSIYEKSDLLRTQKFMTLVFIVCVCLRRIWISSQSSAGKGNNHNWAFDMERYTQLHVSLKIWKQATSTILNHTAYIQRTCLRDEYHEGWNISHSI